jgi:hypothetical protein
VVVFGGTMEVPTATGVASSSQTRGLAAVATVQSGRAYVCDDNGTHHPGPWMT